MRIEVRVSVLEGYSDRLTGKLSEQVSMEYDLPAVPAKGDYVETAYGTHAVEHVTWGSDGSVIVVLSPIYTLDESQERVIGELTEPQP